MSEYPGFKGVLNYDSGSGMTELTILRDLTLELESSEIDDTPRADDGTRSRRVGLSQWGATLEVNRDPDNTGWEAFRDAYLDKTTLDIQVLDDASKGFSGTVYVASFTQNEPIDGLITNSITVFGNGAISTVG